MTLNTSHRQDKDLADYILNRCTLTVEEGVPSLTLDATDILEFIGEEYAVDDVFERAYLDRWAAENGYVKADKEQT